MTPAHARTPAYATTSAADAAPVTSAAARRFAAAAALVLGCAGPAAGETPLAPGARVETLLAQMTLEEKAGQLNMVSMLPEDEPDHAALERGVRDGSIGSFFNVYGAAQTRSLQDIAKQSRLKIPLIQALDVIHGYRAIFPTPLAQAASWDLEAIRGAERVAATEAAAAGVNMIFNPMLDVTRDPRWGRIVEGAGESPWLAARVGEARIRGLEGRRLTDPDTAVACFKHFGANGAVEGGRDYSGSDVSERSQRETYLPPFRAAVAAGARCAMASFNAPDGLPSVVNPHLLTDILRGEWGFDGLVMSDFKAIHETLAHGVAADDADAARLALAAGADIDMQSKLYVRELPRLVREGVVPIARLDEAARRVLALKDALGLFDDPNRGVTVEREARLLNHPDHRAAALDMAEKSFVLLKNERDTLPFKADVKRVALIGPLGDAPADTLGPWAARGEPSEVVTVKKGFEQRLPPGAELTFTPAGSVEASSEAEIAEAVEQARRADVVVLALGERFNQSGEAASRAEIGLPGDQPALARAVLAVGKPTVAVVIAGRPLALTELSRTAPAILNAWQPGSMGGLAVARMAFGDVAPSGRLPVSYPRSVGQIPIHHDQRPTGRPAEVPAKPYTTGYSDESPLPLYPFGYGLAYTRFAYAAPKLDRTVLRDGESATVSVEVRNEGARPGVATVQLYLRQRVAKLSRPLKDLRGFARITLDPGETGAVEIPVTPEDLAYWRSATEFGPTAGPVDVMTGPDAQDVKTATLEYRP